MRLKIKAKHYIFFFIFMGILIVAVQWLSQKQQKNMESAHESRPLRLYWFIPDGFRAEPVTFKIYQWAREGKLPNIKKLMELGSYGYSIPVFPGHTPTNFATLMTGTTPDIHGVVDGAMRTEGFPLDVVTKGGFSSQSKMVPAIWSTLEEQGQRVTLLSIPGSTPPELNKGITIKGRWGGWGIDIPSLVVHSAKDSELKLRMGQNKRVFNFGHELTRFIEPRPALGVKLQSYSPAFEINLSNWGQELYAIAIDTTNDNISNYDQIVITKDKKKIMTTLKVGDWSDWIPIQILYETKNDYNIHSPKRSHLERKFSQVDLKTEMRLNLIKLQDDKSFRIRVLYNHLNEYLLKPSNYLNDILKNVGPMVDFVDNYPPQLVYFTEDKKAFLEEAQLSYEWHRKMGSYMVSHFASDIIIHSIYTPNQMLTSRWWMPYIDPKSPKYHLATESERESLWMEVLSMYKEIDAIIGSVMVEAGEDTYFVLSSDHGAIPLAKEVRLNNLFAKKGWLNFKWSSERDALEIDWEKTKVVYLQMEHIYIHTKGLGGPYRKDSGPEYESLRDQVIAELEKLRDENGTRPLAQAVKREKSLDFNLASDRTGDLIIANSPHYNWVEDISKDLVVFNDSIRGGYKQGVIPADEHGMWTPFIIKGPGVRKNYEIQNPIRHVDQYATILDLLKIKANQKSAGKVIKEIYK